MGRHFSLFFFVVPSWRQVGAEIRAKASKVRPGKGKTVQDRPRQGKTGQDKPRQAEAFSREVNAWETRCKKLFACGVFSKGPWDCWFFLAYTELSYFLLLTASVRTSRTVGLKNALLAFFGEYFGLQWLRKLAVQER